MSDLPIGARETGERHAIGPARTPAPCAGFFRPRSSSSQRSSRSPEAALADGPDPKEPALVEEPLSFVVDESLEPIGGQKGAATIADPHGERSDFAPDELIVVTDDDKAHRRATRAA